MCIARPIPGYKGLVETCRQRADELAISRLELDRLAGLPSGCSSKLLGKDGAGKKQKRMWPIGLEAMLGTLGLKVLLLEDEAATARTLALRTPVDSRQQRFYSKLPLSIEGSASVKIAAPKDKPPPASRAHLRVVQGKRKGRLYGTRKF
jgi:hypothetical protein